MIKAMLIATFAVGMISATTPAQIKFLENSYDMGVLSSKGDKVSTKFRFINTGDGPLLITKSAVSCRCTNIKYPKRPVLKGDTAFVEVTYNPKGEHGVFMKAIQIYSNSTSKRELLTIKGEVK